MQIHQALLIGNAEPVSARLLKKWAAMSDYVLAADGGADVSLQTGILPDRVIGDLDSVSTRTKKLLQKRLYPVSTQENTDLEKALRWLKKQGFTHVVLAGFVGNRWDFSIANLLTLARYADTFSLTVVADTWRLYPIVHSTKFSCKKNKRVSIIPLKTCTEVTLSGLQYPLRKAQITLGTTRTLSNRTTGTQFCVCFNRGAMLVYQEI